MPLAKAFAGLFANYVYVNAKADDLIQASMQASFVSSLDICLGNYRTKFINKQGTTTDIDKYQHLYSSYLGAYKAALDSCYDVAKIDDKFSLGGDCMVWSSNLETLYTYDNYIKWCKEEVAHDIANSELDKTTGSSTVTDALNEETIAARIEKILQIYPPGSKWASNFNGVSSSLGYACKTFNYIYDKCMVGKVEDKYQYILSSNVNVRLIGRLEEGVTEAALKDLFANVRIGDVVITSGQYDYLHAMTVVGIGETGPIVYDVDSKYGSAKTAEEYTHLIQKYEFSYAKMADAFSTNGKYLGKPGISVYRAIKKVTTTNSGTNLYYAEYDDSVNYVIENGVLKSYKGSRTTIDIPDGVTAIAEKCFYNNTSIKYVYMPDTVTTIGSYAFYGCTNLRYVDLSGGLQKIQYNTFYNCKSLGGIIIPNSVTEIEDNAFNNCTSLANITVSNNLKKIWNGVFDETAWYKNQPEGMVYLGNVLYKYKYIKTSTSLGNGWWTTKESPLPEDVDLVIKEGTVGVAAGAISDCHDSLYLPESLECAVFGTFQNLQTIYYNSINLNSGTWDIGFPKECSATTLYIGENVEKVASGMFYGLKSAENVYYNAKNCTNIGVPKNAWNIVIGEKVECIPDGAFYGSRIEEIIFPDSVKEIGSMICANCESLKRITLSKNSARIGSGAFGNTALEEITIPDKITELNFRSVFAGCEKLKSIIVEEGNEKYCDIDGAVYSKEKDKLIFVPDAIERLLIPKSVIEIYYDAMRRGGWSGSKSGSDCVSGDLEYNYEPSLPKYQNLCRIDVETENEYLFSENGILYQGKYSPSLYKYPTQMKEKEYTTPDNLWSMYAEAFANNHYLEKVYIKSENYYSKKVEYEFDANFLFAECSNLKYVDFEVVEKSLSDGMFYNCKNLEGIKFPIGIEKIGNSAFLGCSKLESIEIPDGVRIIGSSAFGNCKSLKSIYLPKTIEFIQASALAGCKSLTDIYYSGTENEWNDVYVSTDLEDVKIHYNYNTTSTPEILTFTAKKDAVNIKINLMVVDVPADASVYVATYDNGGRMLEVKELTLNNGIANTIFSASSVDECKAFIWRKNTLKPLSQAKVCNL